MIAGPRFAWLNGATDPATVITASSEQSAFPAANVRDPSLAKTWRSQVGWTVIAGFNEKIDVLEGAVNRVATIALGTYTLASEYAAAVVAALNAMAGAVNTYSVPYGTVTPYHFSIDRATGAATFALKWSTGTNAAKSAGKDLGYLTTADTGSGTSHLANYEAHQSRHYLDLSTPAQFSVEIVLGENDAIDVDDGTVKLALIMPGRYTDPSEFVIAVEDAFEIATPSAFVGSCLWDSANNQKFQISAGANFTLKWNSGANKTRSIGPTMGYSAASDDTGAASYFGDTPVYAYPQVQVVIVQQHNMRFQGTVKLLGDIVPITSATPDSTQTLVGTDRIRLVFMTLESYRYRRLLIEDVQNSDGFNELGVLFFGPYYEAPGWHLPASYDEQYEQLSGVFRADRGAFFQDRKPQAKRISGTMRVNSSGKASLEQLQEAVSIGGPFFFTGYLTDNSRAETFYVVLPEAVAFTFVPGSGGKNQSGVTNPLWDVRISMVENLP